MLTKTELNLYVPTHSDKTGITVTLHLDVATQEEKNLFFDYAQLVIDCSKKSARFEAHRVLTKKILGS